MAYGTLNAGAITPGSGNTLTISETVSLTGNATLGGTANALGTVTSGTLGTSVVFSSFVGMIAPFAMSSPPTGWLTCDGAAYNSSTLTQYASLYTAIGNTWGGSDGTDFQVPDLRGGFLRGVGASTGFTVNHTTVLATKENDAFQGHWHDMNTTVVAGGSASVVKQGDNGATYNNKTRAPTSDGVNGTPRIANETRPNNIGVQFYIKF